MSDNRNNICNAYTRSTTVEVYEYIAPGAYLVPMMETMSAAAPQQTSAYLSQDYTYMTWPTMTTPNPATYVVSTGGVVNYLSDLQQHMALPHADTMNSGLIYGILQSGQRNGPMYEPIATPNIIDNNNHYEDGLEEESIDDEHTPRLDVNMPELSTGCETEPETSVRQSLSRRRMTETDENSDDGVSPPKRQRIMTPAEMQAYKSKCEKYANVFTDSTTVSDDDVELAVQNPRKHRRRKHIYRTEEGYLVEEPSEPDSDETDISNTQGSKRKIH